MTRPERDESLDHEFGPGYSVYVQPGGCVELTAPDDEDGFVHICDWGLVVREVDAEIERRKPYRDPRTET